MTGQICSSGSIQATNYPYSSSRYQINDDDHPSAANLLTYCQRRMWREHVWNKSCESVYAGARQVNDRDTFFQYVTDILQEECAKTPLFFETDCADMIQRMAPWVWMVGGTWKHPERRHKLTREECARGGCRSGSPSRISDEIRAKIRSVRMTQGLSYRKIAAQFGISKTTIARICKGLPTPNGLDRSLFSLPVPLSGSRGGVEYLVMISKKYYPTPDSLGGTEGENYPVPDSLGGTEGENAQG